MPKMKVGIIYHMRMTSRQNAEFARLAAPYLHDGRVRRMAGFVQHGSVSTLDHCVRVARTSYAWSCALPWRFQTQDLVAGALLHDFYLYDWHDRSTSMPHHATMHPVYAERNAVEAFGVNGHVASIIRTHMWPLPPDRVPRSREAVLVSVADKWCSLEETLLMRGPQGPRRRLGRI